MARTGGTRGKKKADVGQTGKAPQEPEGLLRAIVENSLDATAVLGLDGTILYETRSIENLLGYRPEDRIGGSPFDHIHPRDTAHAQGVLAELGANPGAPVLTELRVRHADGSYRTLQVLGRNLTLDPTVGGIVIGLRDVTTLRRGEQALRESEEKWRTLVENTTARVLTVDREGRIISVNRVAEGRTMEEVVGSSVYEYLEPPYRERVREALRSVFQSGETAQYEAPAHNPDGSTAWYETSLSPVRRGKRIVEAIGLALDVTERKRAEEALLYERDLVRTLFENHPDFIYFKDSEARFQRASRRFCDLFRRSMQDIIGKTDLELFPEELAKQTYSEDLHIITTGTPIVNKEETDGQVWVLTTKLPWVDREGNVIGLFGISRDITELKKAEEELARHRSRYWSGKHSPTS